MVWAHVVTAWPLPQKRLSFGKDSDYIQVIMTINDTKKWFVNLHIHPNRDCIMVEMSNVENSKSALSSEPAAMSRLLSETARAWTRSFGVKSEIAEDRLVSELRSALRDDMVGAVAKGNLHDMLDEAAHSAIATWLAHVTGEQETHSANKFAMLRCAFLSANQGQNWCERFLDRKQSCQDLNMALQAQMMLPTPARQECVMPRQTLAKHAS